MFFAEGSKHYSIPEYKIPQLPDEVSIIIVHSPLAPDVMAFLEKMISAFGWSPDQCYHLIHEATDKNYYNPLWKKKSLKLILSFGFPSEQLGLHVLPRPYHLINLGTFNFYQADALEKTATSKELKGKIWNDLKTLVLTRES